MHVDVMEALGGLVAAPWLLLAPSLPSKVAPICVGRWSWAAAAVGTPSCLELVRLQSSNTTVPRKSLPVQILVFHQNILSPGVRNINK